MEFAWILLGLAGWAIGLFLVLVLMQITGDQEDATLKIEKGMTPRPKAPVARSESGSQTGDRQ